jgi:multiple sugar transport system permease protein
LGRQRNRSAYLFLSPFLILFLGFFIFPIIYAVNLSLYASRGLTSIFVGFNNYTLASHDTSFWSSIVRMLYFGAIQVTIMLLLALIYALFLDSPLALASGFFRLIYFLPYAVPGVIGAIVWAYLYAPDAGPLQGYVSALGLHVNLLDASVILYSIMVIVTWEWTGYNITLYNAGLASISPDLYEAARMDGASEFWIAVQIKIPLLRPILVLTAVLSIIGTLQLFNEPYVLSPFTPIPITFTPNLDIYNTAFQFGSFNYAAALAMMLAAITFVASYLFLFLTGRGQSEGLA